VGFSSLQEYLKDPEFRKENIASKSFAAAELCEWVINIIKFYDIYLIVEPKRQALNQANLDLSTAQKRLQSLNSQIASLEEQLAKLTTEFQEATEAKLKCQAEADATACSIDLANRLVKGLGSESVRWKQSVATFKDQLNTLPGDILMVTAFISYVGCFTHTYRIDLLKKYWEPFLNKLDPAIPVTPDLDPMQLLTDDAQIAQWNNEGLPNDRMSAENATVLTNSERWPLMIDPQLQGIKWIKNKYGSELKVQHINTVNSGSFYMFVCIYISAKALGLGTNNMNMEACHLRFEGMEVSYLEG
jgi:dynein heavy chain